MISATANHLRQQIPLITRDWVVEVVESIPELQRLPEGVLIDHLPEFLDGLAGYIEGRTVEAKDGFRALVDGHALTRLGHGIALDQLIREYVALRRIVLQVLLPLGGESRADLIRLNDGMDLAIQDAINGFATRRELIRERFLAMLGHDLRVPLNAIKVAASALTAEPSGSEQPANMAKSIQRATGRMARLVSDLMEFARSHFSNGIPTEPVACDMAEIVRFAIDEVKLSNADAKFDLSVSGDTWGTWDHDRAMQAMVNLATNAAEHGEGVIVVTVRGGERAVTTSFANAGPEISPDLLPVLFDPFRIGESKQSHKGLGLGLFVVQQIALAHGALCDASSGDGWTTFTIRWPRVPLSEFPRP